MKRFKKLILKPSEMMKIKGAVIEKTGSNGKWVWNNDLKCWIWVGDY